MCCTFLHFTLLKLLRIQHYSKIRVHCTTNKKSSLGSTTCEMLSFWIRWLCWESFLVHSCLACYRVQENMFIPVHINSINILMLFPINRSPSFIFSDTTKVPIHFISLSGILKICAHYTWNIPLCSNQWSTTGVAKRAEMCLCRNSLRPSCLQPVSKGHGGKGALVRSNGLLKNHMGPRPMLWLTSTAPPHQWVWV